MTESATKPHPPLRLLTLHHELLYPAFLGAALFEFAKKIAEEGPFTLLAKLWDEPRGVDSIWFISGLWFLIYFSAAFLAFTEPTKKFGWGAFLANLVEIGFILYVTLAIARQDASGALVGIDYGLIYITWIAIPVTGGASNLWSGRRVHVGLSAAVILLGIFGLVTYEFGFWHGAGLHYILQVAMYLLLLAYIWKIGHPFDPESKSVSRLLFHGDIKPDASDRSRRQTEPRSAS
jgi:hypothetical protein